MSFDKTRIDTTCLQPPPGAVRIAGTLFVVRIAGTPFLVYPAPLFGCKRVSFDMFHVDNVNFNCLLSLLAQQARNLYVSFWCRRSFFGCKRVSFDIFHKKFT